MTLSIKVIWQAFLNHTNLPEYNLSHTSIPHAKCFSCFFTFCSTEGLIPTHFLGFLFLIIFIVYLDALDAGAPPVFTITP